MADTLMFKRLNPPSFNGSRDFFVISEWLSQMEKHFEYAGVPEAHKVHLAAYQLTEDAYTWWLQRRSLPIHYDLGAVQECTHGKVSFVRGARQAS
ncbi:hypothetical protein KSP39_PZI012485 [Platanthera zijinensis]|uniref:Retrotransposon gag domain-containing protein n=1 Tax=Platanthera zijinensis TaxID=2320716 RepID=A0AAP0BEX4_9ASPA